MTTTLDTLVADGLVPADEVNVWGSACGPEARRWAQVLIVAERQADRRVTLVRGVRYGRRYAREDVAVGREARRSLTCGAS